VIAAARLAAALGCWDAVWLGQPKPGGVMRRIEMSWVALLVVLCASALQARDATAPLQGRWVVVDAEHNGKPMKTLNGGVMTVTGNAFEIRTASGNVLKGALRLDTTRKPLQMDLIHADGAEWEAVYEVTADSFRLNYVVKGEKDPRPATFKTSEKTEESLVVLRREAK
jgi:uncharacterized protein (TIGR03067 family)